MEFRFTSFRHSLKVALKEVLSFPKQPVSQYSEYLGNGVRIFKGKDHISLHDSLQKEFEWDHKDATGSSTGFRMDLYGVDEDAVLDIQTKQLYTENSKRIERLTETIAGMELELGIAKIRHDMYLATSDEEYLKKKEELVKLLKIKKSEPESSEDEEEIKV